jgi:hypothetical protein
MGDVVPHMQSPFHNGHKCKLLYYFLIRSYSLNWDLHPGVGLRPSLVIPYGFSGGADTIHPAITHALPYVGRRTRSYAQRGNPTSVLTTEREVG